MVYACGLRRVLQQQRQARDGSFGPIALIPYEKASIPTITLQASYLPWAFSGCLAVAKAASREGLVSNGPSTYFGTRNM